MNDLITQPKQQMKFIQNLSETGFIETIDFTNPFKILVQAPTGAGKTHYVVNYLKEKDIPFVFLTDTLLLMNQISEDYKVPNYCAKNKIHYNSHQIITVYNHIEKFWKNRVIVVDEAHSLVTEYGFKRDIIDMMLIFIAESSKVLLLSGTPITSKDEAYEGFTILKCEKEEPKRYDINLHRLTEEYDKLEYVTGLAIEMKNRGIVPVISLLNTNKRLNDLLDYLKSNGFKNVGMINSLTKEDNKEVDIDCTHYEELVKTGTISADVIVTTYVQGYNINNENCGLIVVPSSNKHTYVSIAQMVARFRKMDDIEIHLVTNAVEETENKDKKIWRNFSKMWEVIERSTEVDVLSAIEKKKKIYKTERGLRHFFNTEEPYAFLVDDKLNINYQMLALDTVNKITHQMYKNIETANLILNQYNIFVKEIQLNISNTMEKQNTSSIDYEIHVDLYFSYIEVGKFYGTAIGYKIHKKYMELKTELHMSDNEIKKILKQSAGNEKAYNRIVLGHTFRQSDTPQYANMRRQIYKAIKTGKWYSSQQIFDIVSEIINDNGGECNSKNKASEILNFLFETTELVKKIDGKPVRGFEIKRTK